jgi:hypothetical protein
VEALQQTATLSPEARKWVKGIISTPSKEQHSKEIGEFINFVTAMEDAVRGDRFDFPGFTFAEISCWRVFVQLFPASLRLLEDISKYPERWVQRQHMSASLLLSTLA